MEYHVDYSYLRPKKAEILRQWQTKRFICRSDLDAKVYRKATVLPIKVFEGDRVAWGRGGMIDLNGEYVSDSSLWSLYGGCYETDACDMRDEKVVFCGYLIHHWGHFLLDTLSRVWYALKNDSTVDKYIFIVENGASTELKGNYREFFSLLGILDKMELVNQPVQYREVILPELGYDRETGYWSDAYKQIFEKVSSNIKKEETWKPRERIYLSRGRLEKALSMESGLDFLDHYFLKNQFEVLYPERLSLSYLIYMLNNASVVACESGSLQHNMLFGGDGQKLIIVDRYAFNDNEVPDINVIKKLDVTVIDGNLSLYPVELSYGPFMFYYNKWFEKFTKDYGYLPPDDKYLTETYRKKIFKQYFEAYLDEHRYQWYMGEWMIPCTDSLYEAYEDTIPYFEDYMKGRKPFLLHHYFSLHYVKQYIKRLLRKA